MLTGNTTQTPAWDSDSIARILVKVPGAAVGMQASASFDQDLAKGDPAGGIAFHDVQVLSDGLVGVTLFWWGGTAAPPLANLYVSVCVWDCPCTCG